MSRTLQVKRDGVFYTYTLLDKLGKGSFSQVFKCLRKKEGKEEIFVQLHWLNYYQAVKVFNKSFLRNERTWKRVGGEVVCHSAFEKVELEIALMKRLNHPNLVKLIDVVDDANADRYEISTISYIDYIWFWSIWRMDR